MIELLILHELSKKVLTMYGISKEIHIDFSVLTTPSYGTIKPALNRLERAGYVKTQKTMSSGGRPSTYYSVTKSGMDKFKELILEEPMENPINFLSMSRIKLSCADVLTIEEQRELLKNLKLKSQILVADIKSILEKKDLEYYPKLVFDNLICEYKNFISLLEGFEHACKN